MRTSTPSLFPMFLKLEGRNCLVLGAGSVGEPKIRSLLDAGARVRVVAATASDAVREWARKEQLRWDARNFVASDLDGVFLVVAATSSREANHEVYREAQARGILCNVVDDPPYCDFYYPAVVRRGHLQIAISTAGLSPALAQRIRKQLELEFPAAYGDWLEELGRQRESLFRTGGDAETRRKTLHEIVSPEAFKQFRQEQIRDGGTDVPARPFVTVLPGEDARLSINPVRKESL